jgi:hypothetical protein
MPRNTLHRVILITAFTISAAPALQAAHAQEPYGPTPPAQSTSTGAGPVFDDGTWTIETMLAARHAQLTPTWWESLF